MSWARRVPAVFAKELLLEWRDPSRTSGLFVFSLALLLILAFAVSSIDLLREIAGGAIWLALLLASTRSLDQSLRIELENGALEGMVLWPVHPLAIYYGKAIANAVVLLIVALVVTPLVVVLYHPAFRGNVGALLGVLALGAAGLAAPGTLIATLTVQARGSSALLPMLLFPVVVPVVLASARATTLIFEGDPMGQLRPWVVVLLAFDTIHWAIGGVLFTRIVDEG